LGVTIYIGTCFPDVIVNGNDKRIIDDVFDVIATGVQSDIKAAFSKNLTVLERYIAKETVAEVISGNLIVTSTYRDSGGTLHYMIFKNSGQSGTLRSVYPFKA